MTAASLLDAALARSPLQPLFRRAARRRLTVLAYHGVEDPARFSEHLDHLLDHARPVGLSDLLAATSGGPALPPRPVLVTFDDGDRSLLDAAPLLRARGIPAAVFPVASLLDGDVPPWWREVEDLLAAGARPGPDLPAAAPALIRLMKALPDPERRAVLARLREGAPAAPPPRPQLRAAELPELEAAGIEVGNHTWSHPCLPRCDAALVEEEVLQAHDALAEALGHPPRAFAYPNGDHDPRAEALLARLGYRAAFLFDHRLSPAPPPEPLRISRIRVSSHTPMDRFRILLSGLHPAVHRALGRS